MILALKDAIKQNKISLVNQWLHSTFPEAQLQSAGQRANLYLNNEGISVCHYAVRHDQVNILHCILAYFSRFSMTVLKLEDEIGQILLHIVRSIQMAELILNYAGTKVALLINKPRQDGSTPLHLVYSASIARCLLEFGASINYKNHSGSTPLHNVNSSEVAEVMLQCDDILCSIQNGYGHNPLHIVCTKGNWEIAKILLMAGINPYILDRQGESAFTLIERALLLNWPYSSESKNQEDTIKRERSLLLTQFILEFFRYRVYHNVDVEYSVPLSEKRILDHEVKSLCSWKPFIFVCLSPRLQFSRAMEIPLHVLDHIVMEFVGPWGALNIV